MDRMKLFCGCLKVGFLSALVYGASQVKMSYIVGSYALFFSGSSMTVPLIGALGSIPTIFALSWVRALVHSLLFGSLSLHSLVHVLPGLCASLYWAQRTWVLGVALPAVCMVLFWLHPVGAGAWMYALYWLIPVVLYLKRIEYVGSQALGSTFVAHAVGSVIWLYTKPMTSAVWLSLIPVVAVERLGYALGMVALYYGIRVGSRMARTCAGAVSRVNLFPARS